MTYIDKIILALVIVHLAVVLSNPYDPRNDDGEMVKRDADCGGGCEPEGCFSRRCRSSCRHGERHISIYDNRCSGGDKCCMCHVRWSWGSGCVYDP